MTLNQIYTVNSLTAYFNGKNAISELTNNHNISDSELYFHFNTAFNKK